MPHEPMFIAIGFVVGLAGGLSLIRTGSVDAVSPRIEIAGLTYNPRELILKPGQSVEFVNEDFVDHTATGKSGGWDLTIAAGSTARFQFDTPGAFKYYCRYHPQMTGTIRVEAK